MTFATLFKAANGLMHIGHHGLAVLAISVVPFRPVLTTHHVLDTTLNIRFETFQNLFHPR